MKTMKVYETNICLFTFKYSQVKTNTMNTEIADIKSQTINEIILTKEPAIKTGNVKFDAWFSKGGGIVLRSFILCTGGSGSGKTTMMINLMKWLSDVKTSMYSREMRKDDVKEQTLNVKFNHNNAYLADVKTHPHFDFYMKELEILKPRVVIIDSLQVVANEDFPDMGEERACEHIVNKLRTWVADNDAVLILIGHVTKEGEYKGVTTIKHLVDAHMELVFDKKTGCRNISWSKNRKGEVGKKLYYSFEDEGIELYTKEEWEATKSETRNFADYISSCTSSYVKTLDKNNPNYAEFKKQYEDGIKKFLKTSPTMLEFHGDVLKMVIRLSAKYKM